MTNVAAANPTLTVEQYMDTIFSPTGMQNFKSEGLSYRPSQHRYAQEFGKFLDDTERHKKGLMNPRSLMQMAEVGTGTGKTLPTIVGLALAFHIYQRRGMYSTHTRALRDEIAESSQLVNHILDHYGFGVRHGHEEITIGSFVSTANIIDAGKVEKRFHGSQDATAQKFLKCVMDTYANDEIFQIDDWTDIGETYDFLGNIDVYDLTYSTKDLKNLETNRAYVKFRIDRDEAKNAHIIVMTHAMHFRNSMSLGVILNTNATDRKFYSTVIEAAHNRFNVVIDEADQYITTVNSALSVELSINQIGVEIKKLKASERKAANTAYDDLIADMDQYYRSGNKPFIDELDQEKVFRNLIPLYQKLRGTIREDIEKILIPSRYNMDHSDKQADIYGRTNIHYVLKKMSGSYILKIEVKNTGAPVGKTWRNFNVHATDSFWLLSGTLLSADNARDDLSRKMFGITDRDIIGKPLIIGSEGRINRVVYSGVSPKTFDMWQNLQDDDYAMLPAAKKHFVDFAQTAIMDDDSPMIVLVNSYAMLDHMRVLESDTVLVQAMGEKSSAFLARVLSKENLRAAICLYWSGVNFVHNGKTIFNRICIPVIPYRPLGLNKSREMRSMETFWKMRQGIGRIFRKPSDQGEVWIGDPRFGHTSILNKRGIVDADREQFGRIFDDLTRHHTPIWESI